jgi:hypothetical protein
MNRELLDSLILQLERDAIAHDAAKRTSRLPLLQTMSAQLHASRAALVEAIDIENDQLRADISRIGHERDDMIRANVELQERLSALEDDLK